jgi:hypothetical protein
MRGWIVTARVQHWRELSLADRTRAAEGFFAEYKKGHTAWQFAIDFLSDKLRARPEFVEKKLTPARRIQALAQQTTVPDVLLGPLLGFLLLQRRPHLLRRFVDAAGLPHVDGRLAKDTYTRNPPSREALARAVRRIYEEFDADEVRLYLDCLEAENPVFWSDLEGLRAEAEARRATGGATEAVPPPPAAAMAPAAETPAPSPGRDPLTNLDHVLLDAVVSSVAGGVSALTDLQARDLVEEVVALNPKRLPSYFHRGFLDILGGTGPDFDWPEANAERRTWYLCGAIAGLARRGNPAAIVELAGARREEALALGSGQGATGPAAALAAPLLFDALLGVKGPAAAAEAIQPAAIVQAGVPFFRRVLGVASGLLRELRAEDAGLLLDRLQASVGLAEALHVPPAPEDLLELRRRQAHRARLLGDREKARALLESLLAEGAGTRQGMIRADLGLLACGFRSLGEVRLPADAADYPEAAKVLARGEAFFRKAAESEGEGGHGEYCLGTLLLARGDVTAALPVLSRAVSEMGRRADVYGPIRVFARARLYLARCIAATLEPGRMAHAAATLEAGAKELGKEGLSIVRESLVDIATCDPEVASATAAALEPHLGNDLLDAAHAADLLPRLPTFRESLWRRAEDAARAPALRFADYETLLEVGRRTADIDLQRRALDGLEGLAEAGGEPRTVLLARLADENWYRPAWEPEDARLWKARSLEAAGRLPEAAGVMTALAHECLARGGHDAEGEARGLLERIRALGAGEPDEGLVRRLEALHRGGAAAGVVAREATGGILFIGGNEAQERYREDVVRWAAETWPGVRLTIECPGWSSNWGRELPRFENLIGKADAVVLMRFVRTLLGMHIRRMCGEAGIPWVPCTGHGRDSMKNAIAKAVERLA